MRKNYWAVLFLFSLLVSSLFFVFAGSFKMALGNDQSNSDPNSWPMFHNDLSHTGYSASLGPTTNQTLWSQAIGSAVYSPIVVNGTVYVGSFNGAVYALDAYNGTILWLYQTGGAVYSVPAIGNDVIYVGSWDDNLYALNATNGEKLWSFQTGSYIQSSAAVYSGVVYFASYDASVYALNASTGALIWSFATGSGAVGSSPAVVNGVVYIGDNGGKVYALNATDGTQLWSYKAGDTIYSSPAISNGIVYIGADLSGNGSLYALNAATGSLLWNYQTENFWIYSSPAVAYGIVYVGSNDYQGNALGNVYAWNASSGNLLWSYRTSGEVFSSPALANGVVYIGSENNTVLALNAFTGGNLWSYKTNGSVGWSSPAIAGGYVYVCSDGGNVYAIGSTSPTPTPSPIPTPTPTPTSTPFPSPTPTPIGQQIQTYCTISVAPNPVQIYQSARVNMSIIPAPPTSLSFNNITCTIERPDGTVINNLMKSNTDGSLNLSFAPTESGTWTLYINFPRQSFVNNTKYYLPSNNQTTLITFPVPTPTPTSSPIPTPILPSPSLPFDCISTTTNSGFNVQIQGSLTYNGIGVSNAGIQLSYSVTAGNTWQDLAYANTDDNGSFSVVWFPTASGNYMIKAIFLGNSAFSGVSATNNFAVAPFNDQAQNVFSVTSNSTLTSLTFDSTTNQLSFGVSGTEGTAGYTQVCIPQSLVPDISKLNVLLDNAAINYNSFSNSNDWIITFVYHHSSHTVVIALGATPTATPTILPTLAPTVAPTAAPTSTATPSVTSQPTQLPTTSPPATTVPEFPMLTTLPLLLSLLFFAVILRHRKTASFSGNQS